MARASTKKRTAKHPPSHTPDARDNKSTTRASCIQQLYQDCVAEPNENLRRGALAEASSASALRRIVVPELSRSTKDQQQSKEWNKCCHLFLVLLSWENREGTTPEMDSILPPEHQTVGEACVETICTNERADLEYMTQVAHLLTILVSNENMKQAVRFHVTGYHLWHWMPTRILQLELRQRTEMVQQWGEKPKQQPYIIKLVQRMVHLVEGNSLKLGGAKEHDSNETASDEARNLKEWIFLHRGLELIIDLLSSVDTRTHLLRYLEAIHFAIRCRRAIGVSTWSSADQDMRLTQQLLEQVAQLIHFPMQEGKAMTKVDVLSLYHRRAITVQKMCHRYFAEQTPDIIYAGVGVLTMEGGFLRRALEGLGDEELLDLLHRLRLVDKHSGGQENYDRQFLLEILEEYLIIPPDPLQELQSYPLYPTETTLWDFSKIPPSNANLLPLSHVLALPKLQTRFLSYTDYLFRNFELMRLETAYEIRSDIVDVVKRLRPVLRQVMAADDNENEIVQLQTEFTGWARMALEIEGKPEIIKVEKPLLAQKHPRRVIAEFTLNLASSGDSIRREWDELGEFDNLFLVTVDATKMSGRDAPLLSEYHLNNGSHHRWDSDKDRRIPDVDDRTFPERFGVTAVRGCMILHIRDEEGNVLSESSAFHASGKKRIFRVLLDSSQYTKDASSDQGVDVYRAMNLVVRRRGRENNFRAVLETIRGLMDGRGSIEQVLPSWIRPLLIGQGAPDAAHYDSPNMTAYTQNAVGVPGPNSALDFNDTFISEDHLRQSFPESSVIVDANPETQHENNRHNYRVQIKKDGDGALALAKSYPFPAGVEGNPIKYTPLQVNAIRAGLSCGLALAVGPPGTGKTDVAVQIIACLYHSFPSQRTVIITHSNAALNDIFQKVMARGDIDERYMIRLGAGERDLQADSTHDFTKAGRVAFSLQRRQRLLEEVQLLSESLGISSRVERGSDGSPSYTCETAGYFREHHIEKRIRAFERQLNVEVIESPDTNVGISFPFLLYFGLNEQTVTLEIAREKFKSLTDMFNELEEYRPLELLRTQKQRSDYLLIKQARIVAMTCTHAAIARSHLLEIGFEYDNIVIEEAGQMTEIESFIPLLLQKGSGDQDSSGQFRLKRICLMGDHNQLPPVIKNMTFSKYSHLDQSLFTRLIRMGVPYIQFDQQGRSRREIANLYNWRYKNLGHLEHVISDRKFMLANAGFAYTFQLIDVADFEGKGETTPTAYFYQNVGEAEYVVALFQYMVLIGYPAEKISILTTYNGQKELISDILTARCGQGTPLSGIRPNIVSTVDQYQGQQNDFVLLSLVRTEAVGHIRDVRRLVVSLSRARLGLYVFCRQELFATCYELKPAFDQFSERPSKLTIVTSETYPSERGVEDDIEQDRVFEVEDVAHLGQIVHKMQEELLA